MRAVIADTSCLIIFTKLDQLDILRDTFQGLATTDKVAEEFGPLPNWINVTTEYDRGLYTELSQTLGIGESSCIALAAGEQDALLIIDDRQAKRTAEGIGVECIGSLGTLLIAKQHGVIDQVGHLLDEIQKTDFRVSKKIIDTVRRLAGEL
ncbi:putative nucleic acid-binding protein [Lewinella aquimaris]|uniref:Putative nucleic acid-binding protein n=1 Tax=Neolewinella aquimaris TaxID=1835722 RepID=A0A840EB14_9BACT|nr:DUF3368 domain-containing protein [Neolewinella aquimaris]MBB4081133.1 putative nucleic acid-binding protein [Neolewinella aquimaris]